MKTKLLKTIDYLLLIDEEAEIKENTWYENKGVLFLSDCKYNEGNNPNNSNPIVTDFNNSVIAYYPLNKEAKELEGLPLLPNHFEEVDIEKMAKGHYVTWHETSGIQKYGERCFIEGYKAAQSKGQYSLEDIKKAMEYGMYKMKYHTIEAQEEFVQSLSTKQLPIDFIPMYEDDITNGWSDVLRGGNGKPKFKTTINSEGREELVGKYVY